MAAQPETLFKFESYKRETKEKETKVREPKERETKVRESAAAYASADEVKDDKHSQKYRSLTEFRDFKPILSSYVRTFGYFCNKVDVAIEKKESREKSLYFEDGSYHIALRKGKYEAEVDKCMSELFRLFLEYSVDVDIIQDKEDFYVASRTIRNFTHQLDGYRVTPLGIYKSLNTETITEKKELKELKETCDKSYQLKGLASIIALCYFFGHSDPHSMNWGTQEIGDLLRVYKIDDGDALDEELLSHPITEHIINHLIQWSTMGSQESLRSKLEIDETLKPTLFNLPPEVTQAQGFFDEIQMMFRKIAETDFSKIKSIIEKNITSTHASTLRWQMSKVIPLLDKGPEQVSLESGESLEDCQRYLDNFSEKLVDYIEMMEEAEKYNAQAILKLLKSRHNALRSIFKLEPFSFPSSYPKLS